jgi:aspartokinase
MDMLLSTGERVSCALCAMAINDLGHRAISLTGSQAGIVTDTSHTKARILDVRADRIFAALDEDSIVLVAGFQGVTTALARANVNIDMIIQGEPETEGQRADMSFTIPRDDIRAAQTALAPITAELGMTVATDETMGKVSIVGAGMKTHPGVAAKVFTTLGDNAINIMMISTSPIRISCVVPGDRVPDAVKALHSAFELSGEGTIRPEQPFGEFAS